MTNTRLMIIGGGPAGMSAAIAAARHGIASTIIDEGRALGGQIYREPHSRGRTDDFQYFQRGIPESLVDRLPACKGDYQVV